MPSASGEQEEVALNLYEEAAVEWLYGCRRVMKTQRPDQEDLIRLTLQEEERFLYDETNTGHEDAAT